RPSTASLSWPSLYALVGSLSFALAILLNRVLRATSDGVLVTWQTIGALAGGPVLAWGNWKSAGATDFGAMLLLGIVSCIAHLLITRALNLAPPAALAPLHYSLLLWGVVSGFIFFADVPDRQILLG